MSTYHEGTKHTKATKHTKHTKATKHTKHANQFEVRRRKKEELTYAAIALAAAGQDRRARTPSDRLLHRGAPGARAGIDESAYSRAVSCELAANGIAFQRERMFDVMYRGEVVAVHRLDYLVEDELVLELKAVERIDRVHIGQAMTYLRVSKRRIALVINFNVAVLQQGIHRVVL